MKNGKLLDLYSDYLISAFGQTTATGLATLLDGAVSHDQMQRSLAGEEQTSADLCMIIPSREPSRASTLSPAYIPAKEYRCPLGSSWFGKRNATPTRKRGRKSFGRTKPRTNVPRPPATSRAQPDSVPICAQRYLVCFHRKHEFRQTHTQKGVRHATRRQSQSGAECRRQAAGTLSASGHTGTGPDETCDCVSGSCRICTPSPQTSLHKRRWLDRLQYLVTSNTTLDGNGIAAIYQKRWNVEPYHKSLKQNASLEKSPTQTVTTQTNHLFAALCGYIKLELLKGDTQLNHFALMSKLYLRALQSAFAALRELNPVQLAA